MRQGFSNLDMSGLLLKVLQDSFHLIGLSLLELKNKQTKTGFVKYLNNLTNKYIESKTTLHDTGHAL